MGGLLIGGGGIAHLISFDLACWEILLVQTLLVDIRVNIKGCCQGVIRKLGGSDGRLTRFLRDNHGLHGGSLCWNIGQFRQRGGICLRERL